MWYYHNNYVQLRSRCLHIIYIKIGLQGLQISLFHFYNIVNRSHKQRYTWHDYNCTKTHTNTREIMHLHIYTHSFIWMHEYVYLRKHMQKRAMRQAHVYMYLYIWIYKLMYTQAHVVYRIQKHEYVSTYIHFDRRNIDGAPQSVMLFKILLTWRLKL